MEEQILPESRHFTIIKEDAKGKQETIVLKETDQTMLLEDGSLLMKWHEGKTDYATAIMAGYTGVRNLDSEDAWKLFNYKNNKEEGRETIEKVIDKKSPTLLLPLQGGVCPFDCKGCPFAVNAPETQGKQTRQLGPEEMKILIEQSLIEAEKNDLDISSVGIAFVGSGDATPNPHLDKTIEMIAKDFPKVKRIIVSTVGGIVRSHPTPMQVVSEFIKHNKNNDLTVSVQVSAHNTAEDKRAEHVYYQRINSEAVKSGGKNFTVEDAKKLLLPLEEIARQFNKIIEVQKNNGIKNIRKPSLTFLCTKETEINVKSLQELGFNPENTVMQLRPILSDNPERDCMDKQKFLDIYSLLREVGYDVVLMPVSPSGVELKAA